MSRIAIFVTLVFFSWGIRTLSCAAQFSIDGDWEGSILGPPGTELTFMVHFKTAAEGVFGSVDIPSSGVLGFPLIGVKAEASGVHFEMPTEMGTLVFEGDLRDDTISGALRIGSTSAPFTLKRVIVGPLPYAQEDVVFQSGDVKLAGTLFLPSTNGPHPGVVFVHGAYPVDRNVWRFFADHFARHGVAGLVYDNRGTGASTGDWRRLGFRDAADDALAGLHVLRQRQGINPRRVGLWGKSQGGWVVALTASRSHDVAFLITLSGPAVSPWQQELYRVEHQLRTQGFSEDVIKDALTFMRLKFDVGRMGKDWGKLEAMMHDMHGETWFRLTNPPESLEDLRWFWDHQFAFEPVPVLENITAPMLALFGEVDTFLNVRESVTILEQTSRKKKNDSTIIVFPQADHSLFVATGQGWPQFVPGFLDTMTNWLLKRVDVND